MSEAIKGNFYIIASPSGGGKTSLVRALIESMSNIKISISYTTRPPRPNDVDGEDYNFVSNEEFDSMIEEKRFLEHAIVYGHKYGTSHEWVLRQLDKGVDVILEIDWQGARQIRQQFPPAVSIFILPPSIKVLRQRLQERQQDEQTTIDERMAKAHDEMCHYHEFDYLIVNDDFDTALVDIQSIVRAQRLRTQIQSEVNANLLAELLENR